MRRVASKFVPRFLSVDQKQQRLDVCLDLKENAANDPSFLSNVIMGKETWVYAYDPQIKLNPVNGKVRVPLDRRRQGKWEATSSQCWFVSLIRTELFTKNLFLLVKQSNAAFYVEVLKRLRENVRRKRPDQWRNNTCLLHNDNAPTHAALLTRFLTDNNMTVVPHPPYSPDLAPSDFFLFPKLKMKLKGWRFQTEEIQVESQAILNMLRALHYMHEIHEQNNTNTTL